MNSREGAERGRRYSWWEIARDHWYALMLYAVVAAGSVILGVPVLVGLLVAAGVYMVAFWALRLMRRYEE